MKKRYLLALLISMHLLANAEETVDLGNTVVKNKSRKSDYNLSPKEYKNTYVITQETIREKNYKNVEDVLRDAPGVIVQNTAFGPRVDMRASGEKSLQRVKVLIDGVSINPTEETMASLPINSIPIETVKKIEIIPGGGATLYGSGSVGGVVSISTNSNVTKNNFFMDLNYGSFDNRNFGFAGGYNINDHLYVNYGFNYLNQRGYREEDEKENKIFLAGFDYKINPKNRFRFQSRFSDMKHDSSTQLSKEDLEIDRQQSGLNMDLRTKDSSYTFDYEYRPTSNITFSSTTYRQKQERDITAEGVETHKITGLTTSRQTIGYQFDNVLSLLDAKFIEKKNGEKLKAKIDYEKGELLFGYDYQKSVNTRQTDIRSNTITHYYDLISKQYELTDGDDRKPMTNKIDIELSKKSQGFYIFNKWNVTDKLDLTLGMRREDTKYAGYRKNGPNNGPFITESTISQVETDRKLKNYAKEAGFLYKYNDTGRTFFRYERGFVTPFPNQLTDRVPKPDLETANPGLSPNIKMNTNRIYVPNNLNSEITDTFELGFRDYWWNSLVSASLFLTDTKGEITLISSEITNPVSSTWRYRNIGKTRRMGLELEAEQKIGNLSLHESLTLLNAKVMEPNHEARLEKGDRVPMVPRLKATLGVKYALTEKLSLLASYNYLGKQEKRELDENDAVQKHVIDAYGTIDVGLLYKADAYSSLKLGAKNITGKKYNLRETKKEALPAPERNYYLEMNVRF